MISASLLSCYNTLMINLLYYTSKEMVSSLIAQMFDYQYFIEEQSNKT